MRTGESVRRPNPVSQVGFSGPWLISFLSLCCLIWELKLIAHNSLSNLHWLWARDSDKQLEGKKKKQQNFIFIRFSRILFYLLQRTLILIEGLKCHRTFILKMENKKKGAVPFIISTERKECSLQISVSLVGSHFVSERESHSVVSDSWLPHGLWSPWNSPGQNIRAGSLSLLQGIFPTPGSNPGLPHCRWLLYQLSHMRGCS